MNESYQFFFCHVPKTAGTTFGRILQRNFGRAFYSYYGLWDRRAFTRQEVAEMCALHPQYRCIASHMFSLDLPAMAANREVRALVFVRQPVERILSLYFYDLHLARENGVEVRRDPEKFFRDLLEKRGQKRFFNGQTRHLFRGLEEPEPLPWLARQCEEGRVLLLPTEEFSTALLLLEKLFPRDLPNTAVTGRLKTSPRSQEIPVALLEELADANQEDQALYELARDRFAHLAHQHLGDGTALDKLRQEHDKRCQELRLREKKEVRNRHLHDLLGKLLARF